MKNPRFFLCLVLATSLTAVACATGAPTIMIFGDSLTAGNALGANGRQLVWVSVAQSEVGASITLINEGRGGRQTDSVPQFDQAVARNPKVDGIAIMLGTNDSRDITGQCVPRAVGFITEMVLHARKAYGDRIRILLIAPPNIRRDALVASKPIANERDANLKALESAYRDLAARLGTKYFSAYGVLPPDSLKNDGVHPDPGGNMLLAQSLLPELKKLVAP